MRKLSLYVACLALLNGFVATLWGGPTSLFFTNCNSDVETTGNMLLSVTDYSTIFNRRGEGSAFPTDTSFLFGIGNWNDLSWEAGVDYFGGTDDPFAFNAKMGMKEDTVWCGSPSWSFGIFNAGTKHKVTDQNVLNLVLGHSLPDPVGGRLFVAGYHGNHALGPEKNGFMIGYMRGFCRVYPDVDKDDEDEDDCYKKDDDKSITYDLTKTTFECDNEIDTGYDRWVFLADYCSGKNAIGGGGAALAYYFTPSIYIVSGPAFFNDTSINGRWKWSIQVYFDIPMFDVCCW